jgi:dTDP-glucose pyrophosphorylase
MLSSKPTGLLVHPVDEPRRFGIAFLNPDGTLEKLVEKPELEGRRLANIGAYLFPRSVFETELKLSERGEYEITDYVTALAARRPVSVVEAKFWLPIGTVEAWEEAQNMDLEALLTRR